MAVAAAGTAVVASGEWVFALAPGRGIVKQTAAKNESWKPVLFNDNEVEALARLVDVLIPRTKTPGARDARVHEYLDLAVSVEEEPERTELREGLAWLDRRCQEVHGVSLHQAGAAQLEVLLREVSDENEEHAEELEPGVLFFEQLKQRTIFGYYTSYEGRVEELGLPDAVTMERWRGCTHRGGTHGV